MAGYIGPVPTPQATQSRDYFTATAGQTSFPTSGYTPGYLDVYLNGVHLQDSDFTATNGSDVVLNDPCAADDVVLVVAWSTFEAMNVDYSNVQNTPTAVSSLSNDAGYATTSYVDTEIGNISVTPAGVSDQDNTSSGYFDIPAGGTAERPGSPNIGYIRFNSDIGYVEQYTSAGWQSIATPPSLSSVSPSSFDGTSGTSFTLSGSNFDQTASVVFTTSGGQSSAAGSVTFVSPSELTATTPINYTVDDEPLSVKVTNATGLSATLGEAIDCGGSPAWNTASGTLQTVSYTGAVNTAVSATDPDGQSVSYSITSGSLPPSCTLNATTGAISGSPSSVTNTTTYTFTVQAEDPVGNSSTRSFSIVVQNEPPVWNTSSGTLATINDAFGNYSPIATLSATDPESQPVSYSVVSGAVPAGTSLNGSNGQISGDPTNVSSNTTSTFTVAASDGATSVNRTFSIIVNKVNDGSTAARAGTTASAIKAETGTTTDGYYYLVTPSDGVVRQWWCDMNTDGGGYVLIARAHTQLGQNRGNWFDSVNAGGFSPSSSGFYRGGGYFNNNSQDYIMVETNAGGQVRKARFYWNGYNFNTIPNRNFNQFSHNAYNAPEFASNFNGYNSSIRGANHFSEQFVVSFSGRGAGGNMDRGEWGAYFMIGAHYNGSHQHHEEAIANNDYDGTGAHIYGGDIRHDNHSGSGYAVATYGAYTNFWAKT